MAAGLKDMVEVDNDIVLDKGKLLKKAFQLNVI